MGGYKVMNAKEARKESVLSVKSTHQTLRAHPKIQFPPAPKDASSYEAVEWALKCVAEYLSPRKLSDEDNEFACKDLAKAIKGPLLKELLAQLPTPNEASE